MSDRLEPLQNPGLLAPTAVDAWASHLTF